MIVSSILMQSEELFEFSQVFMSTYNKNQTKLRK